MLPGPVKHVEAAKYHKPASKNTVSQWGNNLDELMSDVWHLQTADYIWTRILFWLAWISPRLAWIALGLACLRLGLGKGGEIRDTKTLNLSCNMSKFVGKLWVWQVVSLVKNEQQSQNLLLKVDPRSTFRNNFLLPAANVFVCLPRNLSTLRRRNLETEVSLWKRTKRFPSTLRRRKLKTQRSITGHFGFVFEENSVIEITWLSRGHRFQKAPFSKCSLSTRNGLVWTVGVTVEIKLRFQIPQA